MSMSGELRLGRFSAGPSMGTGEFFRLARPSTLGVSVKLCFKSTCSCSGNASLSEPVSKFACDGSAILLCVRVGVGVVSDIADELSAFGARLDSLNSIGISN